MNVIENVIFVVVKICKYNCGNIVLNEVILVLIGLLLIIEDKEEVLYVYGYLCDLIEGYVS